MKREITIDQLRLAASQNSKERAYWLATFPGEIPKSHFPYDSPHSLLKDANKPTGKIETGRSQKQEVEFRLPGEVVDQLMEMSKGSAHRLHMILAAGLSALLYRYLEHADIVTGMPIYRQENANRYTRYINTALALRLHFNEAISFRELLNQVRQALRDAVAHQDYPVEVLAENLNLADTGTGFPLFDTALLLESIHDRQDLEHLNLNLLFCFPGEEGAGGINGTVMYHPGLYNPASVRRITRQYRQLLEQALTHPDLPLLEIDLLPEEEKKWLLENFNHTRVPFPREKSLVELLEQQVEQTPHRVAVKTHLDLSDVYDRLEGETIPADSWETVKNCCFKKNPYVSRYTDRGLLTALGIFSRQELQELIMLRTQRDNYVAVDTPVFLLLDYFSGDLNLESILRELSPAGQEFRVFATSFGLQNPCPSVQREHFRLKGNPWDLLLLARALYKANLLELAGYREGVTPCEIGLEVGSAGAASTGGNEDRGEANADSPGAGIVKPKARPGGIKSPVLLLGDRTGTASTGLLYIASFLRRNGIEAFCQWNDLQQTRDSLTKNLRQLLARIQPQVVGVSMKWFPHIARVLEICRQVKAYDPSILVVVGGNTASYYKEKIIQFQWIDYVVLGDGEVPFLQICLGNPEIPNSVYKRNGEIISSPITYVQDETNSREIFLSHLEEIFVSRLDPYLTPHFYINTGKGCPQQCFYCGGCREAQKITFNRSKPFLRGSDEVRQDLSAAREYTRWFMFDFDLPLYGKESGDYYASIWEGIDLTGHFCRFYFWQLPSTGFIELVVRTFKYVELNIDLCSLSESHRLRLSSLKVVKPQPTDAEILSFFDTCEKYDRIDVIINLITGLPYFSEADLETSEQMLERLLKNYTCFKEMDWGRLHAQPGAPIVENSEQYNMISYAKTFEDFLSYSRLNLEEDQYPDLWTFNYPYIYFQDEDLNSKVTNHYFNAQQKIQRHLKERRRGISAQTRLTLEELHERSNGLAGVLREKGVIPGALVGLLMERSEGMIVGMVGILKAGAAYLPLDPNHPGERIRCMLSDSNTHLVVTTRTLAKQVEAICNWQGDVYYLEDLGISSYPLAFSSSSLAGEASLAYVMYTSGSTGKPRGVLISHANVARLVTNSNFIDFRGEDRLLPTGAIGFDISTFEIWASLLNGVLLVLADQHLILEASLLENLLKKNKITLLHLIPQLFNQLAEQNPGIFDSLRVLLVGGDLVRPGYVNRIRQRNKRLTILHMYGPTENTTFSTFLAVEKEYETAIPIGKPIGNSSVYLVDKHNRLKPRGAVGELCVGGAGVARGYLNHPELTAERFNKMLLRGGQGGGFLEKSPPQTIYKTGDLARWLPEGNLEFLGRADFQVKIRGIRIELGEIENRLLKHPHVKNVIVTAGESAEGDKYLAAYWEPWESANPGIPGFDGVEPGEYLSKELPGYMVPSYFIKMKKLPLTAHGKVDRQALPEPKPGAEAGAYTAPRDPVEEGLAAIWSEVLKIPKERIGIDMNFNRLGGHSLKATIMAAKIHKTFDVKIPLGIVFTTSHLKDLALYIKKAGKNRFLGLEPVEKREYYDVSPAQKRVYLAHHRESDNIGYNIPMLTQLILDTPIQPNRLEEICRQLIRRHESLRTGFLAIDGQPRQIPGERVDFHIEYNDLSGSEAPPGEPGPQGKNPAIIAIIDGFVRPFDLFRPPLLRLGLIKENEKEFILMVDIHHIIADEFSREILVKDFTALLTREKLPSLKLQYRDYSQWQNKLFGTGQMKQEEEYWLKRFSGETPRLNLPTDFPRAENPDSTGTSNGFRQDEEETRLLSQLARQEGVTLYMVLAALFTILLSKIANQEDILIGTPVLGRTHADLQQIIGMFVNTLVLRNSPTGSKAFSDFLQEVKTDTLEAFENQDYPFEDLVEQVAAARDRTRHPLFDVMFDYHELEANPGSSETGLRTPYALEHRAAKFDIDWSVSLSGNRLYFSVAYRTSLFEKGTLETFIAYYRRITAAVLENPRQTIAEIEIASENERSQNISLLYQDLEIDTGGTRNEEP
jgi:amino acid adenylation domain-containing protein